ncbi:DUF5723 family protein [Neotamlana laminarinivorans]|uniref:DUF5723 family protein n=1 Tax=Neotamlana laminarinivorans TaxID=2883124 RepID=A0A9X1L4E6_9FLAO|nr:DUF5723 family protein [Tamlana laminarinivorans]MCB4799227.1 DUF5723 family protein [Tamlana laminarinivorans]
MKNALLLIMLFSAFCFAQNKQILYGFSDIPQTLLLNPGANVNQSWHVGMPLLSHLHINAGTSKLTVYDLFADDNVDFNAKLENAIYSLNNKDFFTATQQLEILSGGFAFGPTYQKDKYLSFGWYQETDFIAYFPEDYAILAYEGNVNNTNRVFNIEDLSFKSELLSVFHIGFNKKVNNKLTYGIRGKIYSSLANITSTSNKGEVITRTGTNNLLSHTFNLNMAVKTSGVSSLLNDDNSNVSEDISTLSERLLFGGNLGLGVDFGFTYQIDKQWYADASITDIGFINHKKDVENYELKGTYVYEGVDPLFPDPAGGTADNYWSEVEEDFEELFKVDTTTTSYTTLRPVKFNASLNYAFGKRRLKSCDCLQENNGYINKVGAQLYAIKRPEAPQLALTTYYYRRLFNGFDAKATYTIDSYSFNNLGLGVSANVYGLNIYAMADNLLNFKNIYDARSVSLQFGINYIFSKNEN